MRFSMSFYVMLAVLWALVPPAGLADQSATPAAAVKKNRGWMQENHPKVLDSAAALLGSTNAQSGQKLSTPRTRSTIDRQSGKYVALNIVFTDAEACKNFTCPQMHLIARVDKYADMFALWDDDNDELDSHVVKSLDDSPQVVFYEQASEPIFPPLPHVPVRPESTRAPADSTAVGGIGKYTGKGVIVAVIDSGIDFRHPDFIAKDESGKDVSRILYFWDTTSELYKSGKLGSRSAYTYPNKESIGTVFNRDELTANLHNEHSQIADFDNCGHGTACAGIAAGNGQAGPKDSHNRPQYAGVAPEADLIVVRIGSGGGGDLENAYLLGAACEWLNQMAANRPMVVSCSFGGHEGGHDGFRVEEQELDARFPLDKPGRAICIAAGNEGDTRLRSYRFHADTQVHGKDNPSVLKWNCARRTHLNIYFQTESAKAIDFDETKSTGLATYKDEKTGDQCYAVSVATHPLTKQIIMKVVVEGGEGSIALFTTDGKPVAADAYFPEGSGAHFDDDCFSAKHLVGTPGTAEHPITVASYDWNDQFNQWGEPQSLPPVTDPLKDMHIGALSAYSSPGYCRFGDAVKPEIASPGQWYAAPAPVNVALDRDTTGLYQEFNGTSAATPYTAGVVALLMQKYPHATLGQIKKALEQSATPPTKGVAHDKPLPNPYWGHGKLDRGAVERLLKAQL